MKNIIRRITVALLLLVPAVALAGDGTSESCCHSSCCPDCGHCPNR